MVTTRPPKTIVKPTALGPVANTDTKLLIYGLFRKGRVLAQDGGAAMSTGRNERRRLDALLSRLEDEILRLDDSAILSEDEDSLVSIEHVRALIRSRIDACASINHSQPYTGMGGMSSRHRRRRSEAVVPSIYSSASSWVSEVSPAARNTLDFARIPRASKLLICGLFQKGRVLAQDGVDGAAGRLAATAAAVTRFRTGLEGSRAYTLAGRLSLTPSVAVGLRHDGGDAETGAGMDVGGGLVVSDASTGLAIDLRVRTLVLHQAAGFRERGMALSLSYNPTPSTPLGLTAKVAPSWGGQATSGAQALWGQETMAGMGHSSLAQGNRLDGEVGYGLPVGSRFVGTPTLGVGTSADGRDYRLGYRLGALGGAGTAFELGVEAHRRESPMLDTADNGFLGRATVGW